MKSIYCQCQLWGILLSREGLNYEVNGNTVFEALTTLYHRAGTLRYWRGVRYCSSLLHHTVDSISPFITTVLVNGKQVEYFCNFTTNENMKAPFPLTAHCWCDRSKGNSL